MPRKRTVGDDEILEAALTLVREQGPDALSFGLLSSHVGLSGSTLVQRFGTKANLLRSTLLLAWQHLEDRTAAADAAAGDGAEGVVDLLLRLTATYDAASYADQLLVLREDLRDPVLRERGERWIGVLTEAVERRLRRRRSGSGLGRLVVTHWQGSLTVWSFTREAPLRDHVEASMRALLRRL
jgi:AcrR family transcriptional regulator